MAVKMDMNPYQSPAQPKDDPEPHAGIRLLKTIVRAAFNVVVVVGFTAFVVGAIWLFYNGYPWHVAVTATSLAMIAPLLAKRPWWERVTVSLSVPFAVLGGVAGFFAFFGMFSFSWFRAVFNGKGGVGGLILFVFGFAAVGGLLAGWTIHRLLRLRRG